MFTQKEYDAVMHQLAAISEELTKKLDEDGQDLFEAYCELYKKTLEFEWNNHSPILR